MEAAKKLLLIIALALGSALVLSGGARAYTDSRLMDDGIFDNVGTMSEQQIRDFINSRPTSCLATSGSIFPEPITYSQYGGNVDAARVIYNSARYSDVNPQVILATLQKEQSLITRTNCYEPSGIDTRNKAMGMGCPDGGACPAPAYAGFHQQVMKGTWQLAFNRHRAYGETAWGQNDSITYYGFMTRGNFRRCGTCSLVYYDGYASIDSQSVYMENGTTASLYTYTPHLGQSFPSIFEGWFGSTWVPTYGSAFAGQSNYPSIPAGSMATVYLSYKNAGNQPWYDDTTAAANSSLPVHLATTKPLNRFSTVGTAWGGDQNRPTGTFAAVYDPTGAQYATNPHMVKPGESAKFEFKVFAPTNVPAGTYREYFQPIVEGGSTMNDPGTFLDVTILPTYSSAYQSQSPYPTVIQGTLVNVFMSYTNIGNQTWYDDASAAGAGQKPVHLATARKINRYSLIGTAWGSDQNRPTGTFAAVYEADGVTLAANQHAVAPGQIGKFAFNVFGPTNIPAGTYREYFQPIVEGGPMMNDPGTFLDVSIQPKIYGSAYAGQSDYPSIPKGGTTTSFIQYKNTGNQTWYDDASAAGAGQKPVHLATSRSLNRFSLVGSWWGGDQNRPTGTFAAVYEADGVTLAANQHAVAPGQIGKFNIKFFGPTNIPAGTYREYFQPIIEGGSTMNDPGTFLDVIIT